MSRNRPHRRRAVAPEMGDSLIFGVRPILEILRHSPERIRELLTCVTDPKDRKAEIIALATKRRIAIRGIPRSELDQLAGNAVHQSFAVTLTPLPPLKLDDLLAKLADREKSVLLALDSVTDPQNLGAILRAAECFGVSGVIVPKNRTVGITPTVRKASVGASELVPIAEVSNLALALRRCKEAGYWVVITACGDGSVPLSSFEFPSRTVLVMGGEGDGVRELTQKLADYSIEIPMTGRIESLNVAQATAIALYSFQVCATPSSPLSE